MQIAKSILIGITGIMLVLASEICGQTCLSVFLPDQILTDMSAEAQQSSHHGSHSSRDSMKSEQSSNQHSDDSEGSNHCDSSKPQDPEAKDHCDGSDCEMGCEMWVKSEESIALFIDAFTPERDVSDTVILFTTEDTQDPQWITPPLRRSYPSPLYLRNETLLI